MIHISTIKEMVRISPLDKLEVEKHYSYLLEQEPQFEQSVAQWIEAYQLHALTPELLLANDYYQKLIHGVYQNSFYNVQYHQALYWLKSGLTQNQILLLFAHMRMQLSCMQKAWKVMRWPAVYVMFWMSGNPLSQRFLLWQNQLSE